HPGLHEDALSLQPARHERLRRSGRHRLAPGHYQRRDRRPRRPRYRNARNARARLGSASIRLPPRRRRIRRVAMYQFNYERPKTLADAEALLGKADDPKILAGGQTLIPTLKQRLAMPSDVIDIGGIKELDFIRAEGDAVMIGAATRHATVASSPDVRKHNPALADLA